MHTSVQIYTISPLSFNIDILYISILWDMPWLASTTMHNTRRKAKQWLNGVCTLETPLFLEKGDTINQSVFETNKTCNILSYCLWCCEFHGNSNPKAIRREQQFRIQPVGSLSCEGVLFSASFQDLKNLHVIEKEMTTLSSCKGLYSEFDICFKSYILHHCQPMVSKHTNVFLEWRHFSSSHYFWLISSMVSKSTCRDSLEIGL